MWLGMSRFPPAALSKQMANAAARLDDGASVASWARVDPWEEEEELPPGDLPLPKAHGQPPPPPAKAAPPTIPEGEPAAQQERERRLQLRHPHHRIRQQALLRP